MRYGLHYRPASIGAVPKGKYTVTDHPHFRHGAIEYPEPLTDEQVKAYELVPIIPLYEHAARLIERMGRYRERYRTKQSNIEWFVTEFHQADDVYSTNEVMQLVEEIKQQLNFNSEEPK